MNMTKRIHEFIQHFDINKTTCQLHILHLKPIWTFPAAFYFSLVVIRRRFIFIQNNRLHRRSIERCPFHDGDLLSYHCCLLPDLFIAESTQNMLQFQVATLWTRLNIVLKEVNKKGEMTLVVARALNMQKLSPKCIH